MESRKISQDLQTRVLKLLIYRNKEEKKNVGLFMSDQVLRDIPQKIKEDIKSDFFGRILKQSRFFCEFSRAFVYRLSQNMQEMVLRPGDSLFQEGELDSKVYYLNSGSIQIYVQTGMYDKRKKPLMKLRVRARAASPLTRAASPHAPSLLRREPSLLSRALPPWSC